jgi:hypothetical protein
MTDLERHPPTMIVDCASGNLRDYGKFPIAHYPLMQHYLQQHYTVETTINSVTLYRRNH